MEKCDIAQIKRTKSGKRRVEGERRQECNGFTVGPDESIVRRGDNAARVLAIGTVIVLVNDRYERGMQPFYNVQRCMTAQVGPMGLQVSANKLHGTFVLLAANVRSENNWTQLYKKSIIDFVTR